ncbi:aminotransferase class I/II-fold pyridoxal phosphate-dependent enzyme [Salsipaludibacter albus]|uniref:aminotransferase class I/II-fold pyridoxal phosphate-dependent enzyme n=1 Tax=Salsipaludibacter albus TaxID=2849650 RepID=UPI001EE3F58B|nr:aminotransferase class I/II-fold pyridoxal phosphate-dependent enzyme [Salsipaludibacter albus]MBY5162353.1 aminotransferase class I/II-fold pyridoxal phosphate-dependent enzyme [Salsipaludibacter albus]
MVTRNPRLDEIGAYALEELRHRVTDLRAAGAVLHDFSIGDPDEPTPEFVRRALVDAVGPVSDYPTTYGQPGLRAAVAGFFARRHGVDWVDPATQVLPTAGSKEAIFHLPFAIIDPDADRRSVIWGDPGYPVYGRSALLAGGRSDPVTLRDDRGWLLDLATLDDDRLDAAAIAWLNYPHNPTGAEADLSYWRDQVAVARAHDILLCSDECYQEVWFGNTPPPSVLEAVDGDPTGVVATVSLSKRSGMTGYRSGALVGDAAVLRTQRLLRPNFGTASQDFVQAAATVAWQDDEHVADRRAVFGDKRDVVAGFLSAAGYDVLDSTATFYVWFAAPDGDDVGHAEALLGAGVVASPGRSFGPAGAGWLRLALVPTVEDCRTAVAGWQAGLDDGRVPRP